MAGLVTNLDLFLKVHCAGKLRDYKYLYNVIESAVGENMSNEDRAAIREFSRVFTSNLTRMWTAANRTMKTFMNRNMTWLETSIKWPTCDSFNVNEVMRYTEELHEEPTEMYQPEVPVFTSDASTSTSSTIPLRKPFEDLSNKQKKRRSGSMVEDHSEEELLHFYVSKLDTVGRSELAKIVKHLANNSQDVEGVTQLLFKKKQRLSISEDKALALHTSLDLSKCKYQTLRSFLQEENCAVIPSYQKLSNAKKRCYPSDMKITERGASIRLQALLDHTVQRLLIDLGPVSNLNHPGLKMTWKWGLDGCSSQSKYKQKSLDPQLDDSSVVMMSIVLLRLVDNAELIIWENPVPGSTRYCRPVKFTFTSETSDFVKAETAQMQQEIAELVPTQYGDNEVAHELHMTMIDGKVVNIVAEVPSSATCPICLAKPREINKLNLLATKPLREEIYKLGISSLHMKIRCMECILHISYNQDFELWKVHAEFKDQQKAKQASTQDEFRRQTGLLIDIVKRGFGTTNDGNTARRFFADYKTTSRITGIDENLIFRFSVILQAVSSGMKINIEKFRSYCKETAELYVSLYSWYYMPVSVHKLLIHGADICHHFSVLPIGIMSEEASEARNKDFRNTRIWHTRKTGRKATNEDILHSLLVSSDPHISRIRPSLFNHSVHKELLPETLQLLMIDSGDHSFEEEELVTMEAENVEDPLA